MAFVSTVRINGVDYDQSLRASSYFNSIDELVLSMDGYSTLAFSIEGMGTCVPPFPFGSPITLKTNDGSGSVLRFTGSLEHSQTSPTDLGWAMRFTCIDLRAMADWVTILASDGTGNAVYNRAPGDDLYVITDAGLSVGNIIIRILTIQANANALNALGIGAYTSLSPPTLPATTLTELAALTVVPVSQVLLSGTSLIDEIDQLARQWHPRFCIWLEPGGKIRCTNIFTMTAHALVVPGEVAGADPVSWPSVTRDTSGCFTRMHLIGTNIRPAYLSELAGTLITSWDHSLDAAWTIASFQQPRDAFDSGNLTVASTTTSSVVVTSNDSSVHWVANYWPTRQGWINLINPAGAGISVMDSRPITSCTAMTAGGTSTISWDATDPIDSLAYTKYQIRGNSGGAVDVGRLWTIREPNGPQLGLNTYVGSHLVKRSPIPYAFANNSTEFLTSTAVFFAVYSTSGSAPFIEVPVTGEIVPSGASGGSIRLTAPIWQSTTTNSQLASGIPSTYATGKYVDLVAMVFYNRGGYDQYSPAAGTWSGTAYTKDGIQREKVIPIDGWTYAGLNANMVTLAAEYLAVYQDAVIEGSITHIGVPSGFDPFTFPYALSLSIAGTTSPWDGLNLPVRSVTLRWPQDLGAAHTFTFSFSNKRRPYQGQDLYVHPMNYGAGSSQGNRDEIHTGAIQQNFIAGMDIQAIINGSDMAGMAGLEAMTNARFLNPMNDDPHPAKKPRRSNRDAFDDEELPSDNAPQGKKSATISKMDPEEMPVETGGAFSGGAPEKDPDATPGGHRAGFGKTKGRPHHNYTSIGLPPKPKMEGEE